MKAKKGATNSEKKDNRKIKVIYQDEISSNELNRFPENSFTIIILDKCDHGECITNHNTYSLNSKQLFIHLPDRTYQWSLPKEVSGRRLIVDDAILQTFSPTLKHTFSMSSPHEMIAPNDETYQKLSAEFHAIRKEIDSEIIFPELIDARVRLLALMINLWVEEVNGEAGLNYHNNIGFRFHSLVDKYFKTQKRVSFYAGQLCITPNYLGVISRRQYKLSPLEFIYERVVLEAKKLLHSSDYTIKEISFELGFQYVSHFSFFFRTQTGMTPKEYRAIMDKS
ncbi:MAG: helix-turn-helix domain-containing protein [Sphingobacterium sp.]